MITNISSDAMIIRLMPERRAWKELDFENLKWNVEKLSALLPEGCAFMAVVKADAYGHGAVPVSTYLNRIGVHAFAVATLQEGIQLRRAGIRGEILILGYTPPQEASLLISNNLIQTAADCAHARALNAAAPYPVKVHLKIDTGMHRLGERAEHIEEIASLFALSGLICWCGISQVTANSISSSFENAFRIPPIYSTVFLVIIAAIIVLRKNTTVRVLDIIVPIMAACYFFITIFIILANASQLPAVFGRIFQEAFGFRQVVGGGIGAVIMNGAKRGLFSNEAGSGSAPCAAAAAEISHPAKEGLLQALGVFIDTLLICSCTAMIMLLTPASLTAGLEGMDLLQTSMQYHLGTFGVIFIAVILWLFSFSTFLGILFYARSNVAYLFGDKWIAQTLYKILALIMLFIGGLAAYQFVWDLGDVGVGLMTIFNMIALFPLAPKALASLRDYEKQRKQRVTSSIDDQKEQA